jgi:hypothetical protein
LGSGDEKEKVRKATQGIESKGDQHEFILLQSGIVGLSRHNGFHLQAAEEISDNKLWLPPIGLKQFQYLFEGRTRSFPASIQDYQVHLCSCVVY